MLIRAGMPYRIYGGQRFYDRLEIKNALAYLRLLANRDDDTAMERVINVPTRGIGTRTIEAIREHARDENVSMWRAANEITELKTLPARASNALQAFIDLINQLDAGTRGTELHEQTEHVVQHSGLIEHHEKEKAKKASPVSKTLRSWSTPPASLPASGRKTTKRASIHRWRHSWTRRHWMPVKPRPMCTPTVYS